MKEGTLPFHRRQGDRCFSSGRGAFSLVEVVVALGVISFALLSLIALLPMGLQSAKDSLAETGAVNVLSAVIADRQSSPFMINSLTYTNVPPLTTGMSTASGYFGVAANNQLTNLSAAMYRVDYSVTPPTWGTLTNLAPYQIDFRVSWPATAAQPSGFVESVATYPQP
jgi:uncharacterized protein (TIGR02598 family)